MCLEKNSQQNSTLQNLPRNSSFNEDHRGALLKTLLKLGGVCGFLRGNCYQNRGLQTIFEPAESDDG